MKRLSLTELKAKQAELAKKIEAEEIRERGLIGKYIQEITGECELAGVKSWLAEHVILDEEVKGDKKNDGSKTLRTESALAI